MAESLTSRPDFGRAPDDARKHAVGVVGDPGDAAQDVYDSVSKAARKTAGSLNER
jgi:hypothetical protein